MHTINPKIIIQLQKKLYELINYIYALSKNAFLLSHTTSCIHGYYA